MSHDATPVSPSAMGLRQTGPLQQRSLSLPFSRLVLNPQDFMSDASEVEQNCGPTLPLGIGYWAFDQAIALPQLLSLWMVQPEESLANEELPSRSFSIDPADWTARDHAHVERRGAAVRVSLPTIAGEHVGTATTRVRVKEETPVLRVAVRAVEGQWALHVHTTEAEPVMILPGAAMLGLHYLDLRVHFPQGLPAEADLVLSVIGVGAHAEIDEFRFIPGQDAQAAGAISYETDWTPGRLSLEAVYSSGARVRGVDTFVDHDSVLRELELDTPLTSETPLSVVGRHIAPPVYDSDTGTVTIVTPEFRVAVAVSAGEPIRYFRDESELAAGEEGETNPPSPVGVWAIRLIPGHTRYAIGVGFAPDDLDRAIALAHTARESSASERAAHWHHYFDELLSRVPTPSNFSLGGVDDAGVSPTAVEESYYRAFHGLFTNLLPPQPETGFGFPTIATGKASMWNYGAPGARSAAAWETFLAIQFLGYADAPTAWECFNGLMSLVDEEGSLAGESLPSRKAQTAWVLYCISGDSGALERGYSALKRLLLWQVERPRWVYGTYDNPGEEDAEFLSSLIIDLGFGARIARVLGEKADAALYDRLRNELSRNYEEHCFIGTERDAVQYWFPHPDDAAQRGGVRGGDLQVTMGLAVPDLQAWQVDSLLKRFEAQFDSTAQLAGFDYVKHPNSSYTVAGLIQNGFLKQAQTLLNALLRDVIRSGSFAECYDRGPERPKPWGVRPSIFGMTQVIDAVWLNNGLRMDLGKPHAVVLPGAEGGVSGVVLDGARTSVEVRQGLARIESETVDASEERGEWLAVEPGGMAFPLR